MTSTFAPATAAGSPPKAPVTHTAPRDDNAAQKLMAKALPRLRRWLPFNRFGDNLYHHALFFRKHGRRPSRELLWNDVLFRIKTTDEILDPLRVFVSDKEHVKHYVKAVLGEEYNVPTFAVLHGPADVDRYDFPERCCIKPTHASAQVILRTQGEPVDRAAIKRWFGLNYYRAGREANYRLLRPKVIVEPLIFDSAAVDDYKFFCWNGVPKLIQVDFERHIRHTRKMFDVDWNEQDFTLTFPRATCESPRPQSLAQMLRVARVLSAPFSFVRIDLYSDGQRVLVGEITNVSGNAGAPFLPRSAERRASALMFS